MFNQPVNKQGLLLLPFASMMHQLAAASGHSLQPC